MKTNNIDDILVIQTDLVSKKDILGVSVPIIADELLLPSTE